MVLSGGGESPLPVVSTAKEFIGVDVGVRTSVARSDGYRGRICAVLKRQRNRPRWTKNEASTGALKPVPEAIACPRGPPCGVRGTAHGQRRSS